MSQHLQRRLVQAAGWAFASSWAQLIISLLAFAVIARLIGPIGFGQSTMAGALVALAQVLVSQAAGEVLVQRQTPDRRIETSWFLVVMAAGAGLSLVLIALRGPIAAMYNEPVVAQLLLVYGVLPLLNALQCVPEAIMARAMRFRVQALAGGLGALIGGGVGIGAALAGAGPWSLALMQLSQLLVSSVVMFVGSRWRPAQPSAQGLADMLRYARASLLTRLLQEGSSQLPKLIVGAALGPVPLGLLAVAIRVFDITKNLMVVPLNSIALPAFSRARAEGTALGPMFLQMLQASTAVAYPAFLGLAAVATLIVPVLLGEQWIDAAPLLQIMSLLGLSTAVSSFNGAIIRSQNRPQLLVGVGVAGLVLQALLVTLAVPIGITAAAAAIVVAGFSTWPIAAWIVQGFGVVTVRQQMTAGLPALMVAAVMAAGVLWFVDTASWLFHPGFTLLLAVPLGALLYASGMWLCCRRQVLALRDAVRMARSRQARKIV